VHSQDAFNTMDANHDGVIDRGEFNIAMAGQLDQNAMPVQGGITTYAAPPVQPPIYASAPPAQPLTSAGYALGHHGETAEHTMAVAGPQVCGGRSVLEIQNITVTGGKISRSGIFDKADPYVYFTIKDGDAVCTGKTTTKKNNQRPSWPGETVRLANFGRYPHALELDVMVYDEDLGRDDKLGGFKINLNEMVHQGHVKERIEHHLLKKNVFLEFDYIAEWLNPMYAEAGGLATGAAGGLAAPPAQPPTYSALPPQAPMTITAPPQYVVQQAAPPAQSLTYAAPPQPPLYHAPFYSHQPSPSPPVSLQMPQEPLAHQEPVVMNPNLPTAASMVQTYAAPQVGTEIAAGAEKKVSKKKKADGCC